MSLHTLSPRGNTAHNTKYTLTDMNQDIAYIPVCNQTVLWNGCHVILFQVIVVIAWVVTNNQLPNRQDTF
jgi:hypothetical protein